VTVAKTIQHDQPFRGLILAAGLVALVGGAAAEERAMRFELKEYLHHRWAQELVAYEVEVAQVPSPARLEGPGGKTVPVQVKPLPGGRAEVAFVVEELPVDGSVRYELRSGTGLGGSLVRAEGDTLALEAGPVAVKLPGVGEERFAAPRPMDQVIAPLLAVRGAGGWLGRGRLVGEVGVWSRKTTLVAEGPVYAEVRTEYALSAGRYAMTVRLIEGQPVVLVSEEFDTGPEAAERAYFEFSLAEGLAPRRLAAQGRIWRPRPEQRESAAGADWAIEYGVDCRELSVLGYATWWPETVRTFTLHQGEGGQTLSFFPRRIGSWRNPMGCYLETRANGDLLLSLPLYVKQTWARDGLEPANPYYTGHLEAGWPETASRRSWAFYLSTEGEVFPATGLSALAGQLVRHSDLPLDKVKDWVFEWEGPPVRYPRLYVGEGELEKLRARALRAPGWEPGVAPSPSLPQQYILQPTPEREEALLRGPQGALPGLRKYAADVLERWGYVDYWAPNNAQPMIELVRFDAAMSAPGARPAEREEMQRLAAFVALVVEDQDWHPTQAGWHLGNPNMPPRQEHHLGVASIVLPTHPRADAWRARGLAAEEKLLREMVRPSGAWRECPHYELDAAMYPLFQAAAPLKISGTADLFADPRLKKTWEYLVDLLTPPDPRFAAGGKALRVLPAFGNGSWEFMPLTGWLGALAQQADPAFSERMMWAWREQGRPDYYEMSRLVIDPSLPDVQPDLHSVNYPGFGCVLRSGFPSPDETWMAFRHGEAVEHYNYGDQGSFMLFAKGAPLVLHFGSQYTPYFQGAWYFNRACVNHRPLTEADQVIGSLERERGDYALGTELYYTEFWDEEEQGDYPMRNRAFVSLAEADYARGEQRQREQGVNGRDHTIRLPPNSPIPKVEIPEHTWIRQVLFLKDPDPEGPNYFLLRDDFLSEQPLPGEWNIWALAEAVDTSGSPARVKSRYGVELEVYMAEPAVPRWSTRQDTNRFLAGPSRPYLVDKEWLEVLTNLRAEQEPGKGFLAVLYPRKAGEARPGYETLAGGAGVKVTTPRGTDWVFLSAAPVKWEGEGISFEGRAGAIRRRGGQWTVVFAEPGKATVAGQRVKAEGPMERVVGP
jgi:hypothetical protein